MFTKRLADAWIVNNAAAFGKNWLGQENFGTISAPGNDPTVISPSARLAGASLLQQGAGLLNLQGAVRLSKALKTDIASKIAAGTMTAGADILSDVKFPPETSTLNGTTVNWSRIAFVGGSVVVSGDALFTKFQPIYDPRFTWANGVARKRVANYWSGTDIAANTFVQSFSEVSIPAGQALVTAGVVNGGSLLGTSSWLGKTGVFTPTSTISSWFIAGSGVVMSEGLVFGEK